jgi:hypothetical protein
LFIRSFHELAVAGVRRYPPSGASRVATVRFVPVEFLTDEQVEAYGTFTEVPTLPELERFFFLDDDDRDLIALWRTDRHRLGMAVQICTVRYIGRFLGDDPLAVPWEAVVYLAEQLGIEDASCVKRYPERRRTPYEHAEEIQKRFKYRDFADWREFRRFLYGGRGRTPRDRWRCSATR